MQFQIKQRVFSLRQTYDITDAQGTPVYQVIGKAFSFGNQLDLLDMASNPVAHVAQRVFSMTSEYDITAGGSEPTVVKRKAFTLFRSKFDVEGPAGLYQMEGDWTNWNYTITAQGQEVARIGGQPALFQDRYVMDIADGADVPTLLCLAIVMDEVTHTDDDDD